MISSWQVFADGQPWELLNSGNLAYYACKIFLSNQAVTTETGTIAAGTLGLAISRSIEGGIHEDLDLINHGQAPVQFNLEIAPRSDFADLFEVKSGKIVRRGRIESAWSQKTATLTTAYRNQDFVRKMMVAVRGSDSKPAFANGRISFEVELDPGEAWHACLLYSISDGHKIYEAPLGCVDGDTEAAAGQHLHQWQASTMKIETSNEEFYRFFQQSVDDMASLRLPITGADHLQFIPAAGAPWFVALFGRDSLIVSLQNAMVHPDFARGALEVLSRYQATTRDAYRDAEPGKIPHELRLGELAHFHLVPHTPYYGTADATILYLIVLHNAWRCTGDEAMVRKLLPVAEKCLRWIDHYGDRDQDGFQEYATQSAAGYANQGWKDSGDALVYPDGKLVEGPIALVELQGYVYDAWLRMAEIFEVVGKPQRARALRTKAEALFDHFNQAFWDEDEGFYAFCLDGAKRKVMSIASNPGHCLWSGIVPQDRAGRVVERLLKPDMFSGWGVRTLSADHKAFNPHSYHLGSIWPHDNAIIALGFRRYGFAAEAAQIARSISGAASFFLYHQLPELFAGLQRTPTSFPVQYLGANTPQAWAAGSSFAFLQTITGFQPDAPAGKLRLDPALPDWMPELTIRNLTVDRECFDIRFWRDGGASRFAVLKGDPSAVSQRDIASGPAPWW
jgi:glycogen debranching enzyme